MFLYRLLLSLAAPLLILHLLWGWARGSQTRAGVVERLGGHPPGPSHAAPRPVWLHAASNGELTSARPLIDDLLAHGHRIVITTNSTTAQTLAQGWNLTGVTHRLAPLDLGICVRRFVRAHQPCALLIIENEIWPNRITMMAKRGRPCVMVGARLSEKSARLWARTGLGAQIMHALHAVSAQDAASEGRFLSLGLRPDQLLPRANLKTAVSVSQPHDILPGPRADIFLAASTHEGEEEQILEAFLTALHDRPALRMILAPRHPHRGDHIARLIERAGLRYSRRSLGQAPHHAVYLADTLGEMENWYASAGICFTGGSLVAKGGHTPFEPAAFGCAILHGPDVRNAAEPYGLLDDAGGAVAVADAAALSQQLIRLDAPAQKAMADAAQHALAQSADRPLPELARRLRAIFAQSR
ncbi:3-deoxy-D-manno-octulosonic acid transferase [Rhodobacteraceae bacterium]|nr:3-deoxy-D-manno-octulosonic acid transferase [Paracoccaceae bacterium]